MKNNLYKTSILVEVFLVAIVTLFLIFNNLSVNSQLVEIPYIHPYEFYLVLLSSSLLFLISIVIALLIGLFLKNEEKDLDEKLVKKRNQNHKFWKISFFSNIIISFLLICIAFYDYVTIGEAMIIYKKNVFDFFIIPMIIGQVIIILLIGSVFLSTSVIWFQNRVVAIILSALGLLLFLTPLGYATLITRYCYHDQINADYYNQIEEEAVEVAAEQAIEEETDYSGEEYEEEEDYFSFSDLWDDPSQDEENVKSSIAIISDIVTANEGDNYLGYMRYIYNPNKDNVEKNTTLDYFYKIKNKILKNPEILPSAFENYKHLLFMTIPFKSYIRNDGDAVIELLLLSYYDIQSDDNPSATLNELHRIMTSHPKNEYNYDDDATDFYPEVKVLISDKMLEKYKTLRYSMKYNVTEGDMVWAYSFWARRNKEGTMESVFQILKEIKEHYEN